MVVQVLNASSDLDDVFPASQRRIVVAKIYDPLYFDDEGYLSPFRFMDRFYTHEAHFYTLFCSDEKLKQVELTVPKFYGSYSLDIATKSGGGFALCG